MSWLSWFTRNIPVRPAPLPESSGLSRMDPTRPVSSGRNTSPKAPAANGQAGNRKTERMARRELLYSVVREAMVRAGVLSASYKFKVLSLDQRGRQFLVMMDLANEFGGETSRLAEIEALIAQNAKARYDILVTAVYWRVNEHVAVGLPPMRAAHPHASHSSAPMPLVSQPAPLAAPAAAPRFDPIQAEEVAAFKRALAAAAVAAPVAAAGELTRSGPRSYTLLTGYEDTEMPDPDVRTPALSSTQYGDLN